MRKQRIATGTKEASTCVRDRREDDAHLRHDGRVGHAEILHAVHPQFIVDHGHGVVPRSHLAGTRLMILRAGVLAHRAGPVFPAQERKLGAGGQRPVAESHVVLGHGTGIGEGQRDLDTLHEDRHVPGIAKVIAPYDRFLQGIVASQTEITCGRVGGRGRRS